jgi:DNA polymerase III delta prime subunit
MLNIHQSIKNKLNHFHEIHKIPNLLFHGPSGTGKRTILNEFIYKIYENDKEKIKNYVMYVNCSHGKGIKFIRDELKFFAKTHINSNGGNIFKSIILLNGDKLTIDAQSALRRCIELFNHNTRFFIIAEDKYSLMKPILSRFCEIYFNYPIINNKNINLYKYNIEKTFNLNEYKNSLLENLKKNIIKNMNFSINNEIEFIYLFKYSNKLYEKGYSALDIIKLLENPKFLEKKITINKRNELLFMFNVIRKEFRNEKLLILFILNFMFLSLDFNLENISFM